MTDDTAPDTSTATSGETPGAAQGDGPTGPSEWATRAADAVELVAAVINDRLVRPIVVVARAVVFGVLIAVAAVAMLVWLSIGAIRVLDVYAWPGDVWASYLLVGGLFTAFGAAVWIFGRTGGPAASRSTAK